MVTDRDEQCDREGVNADTGLNSGPHTCYPLLREPWRQPGVGDVWGYLA
jgi:hypothetical protein